MIFEGQEVHYISVWKYGETTMYETRLRYFLHHIEHIAQYGERSAAFGGTHTFIGELTHDKYIRERAFYWHQSFEESIGFWVVDDQIYSTYMRQSYLRNISHIYIPTERTLKTIYWTKDEYNNV